jgi:hypothetical protein
MSKAYVPWIMVYNESFETRIQAREKEIKLKTSSCRRFIRNNYLIKR